MPDLPKMPTGDQSSVPPPLPPPVGGDVHIAAPPPAEPHVQQVAAQTGGDSVERDGQSLGRRSRYLLFAAAPSGLVSAVIHLLLMVTLGLCVWRGDDSGDDGISIDVAEAKDQAFEEPLQEFTLDIPATIEEPAEDPLEQMDVWDGELEVFEGAEALVADDMSDLVELIELDDAIPRPQAPAQRVAGQVFVAHKGSSAGLAGRAKRRRQALALGATRESELAVDLALQWLVRHQQRDGFWSFDHQQGETHCENCRCSARGVNYAGAKNGATSLVLLALLGAGETHLDGRYRGEVADGLNYLIEHQDRGGSFVEPGGRMYSHGLATLALCEALAMARYRERRWITPPVLGDDENVAEVDIDKLREAALRAVAFVQRAQHPAGGWRYSPRQAGDMSVVGWQMMALKSAYLADLPVNRRVLTRAVLFLNNAAEDRIGSAYAYQIGGKHPYLEPDCPISSTTPIGLLCRMYTGWTREQPGLRVGVDRILQHKRTSQGMYFYYYATQVMHHYGGEPWEEWNHWMRDYLVKIQSQQGSEAGSWSLNGPHDDAGRLYCTAMAAMTLEVYYRYSPIYGIAAVHTPPSYETE